MLLGCLVLLAVAPLYGWLVPPSARRPVLLAMGLLGLYWLDPRALAIVLAVAGFAFAFVKWVTGAAPNLRNGAAVGALVGLCALFAWNKIVPQHEGVLPSQGGLAVLGVSYLVLKAAALVVEAVRTPGFRVRFDELLLWLCFLPTYPSGPIEDLEHFRGQQPTVSASRFFYGCERILFGLSKVLLGSHYLGEWLAPVLADPASASRLDLWLGMYAVAARFYLDFSGYSDLAIGLAAAYGYEIEENFDWPFLRRNLVSFWQHWHMTLTRFLRLYLFVPVSRRLLRRGAPAWASILAGQLAAMLFCGVWHAFSWGFVVWGLTQAVGLTWVGAIAPRLSKRLPAAFVRWWRTSPAGYVVGMLLTIQFFSATALLATIDLGRVAEYFATLVIR